MDKLHEAFSFGGVLRPDELAYVTSQFTPRQLRVGEHFCAPGDQAGQIGFVSTGVLRQYSVEPESGQEATTCFMRSNQFVMSIESFYSNQPTSVGIQAITACEMLLIDRQSWQQLCEKVPNLFIVSKIISESALLNSIKDKDFLQFGTATQKYQEFCRRYPDIVLSIPQHHIASYLRVTPQSLSRIRKENRIL